MRNAGRLLSLVVFVLSSFGCASDDTARPATSVPLPPTIARPPLATPSSPPSPVASPSVAPTAETYTVRAGDTLTLIAERVYGDASEWRRIFDANRDQLTNPEGLQVGMTIRIPPRPRP